MQNEIIVDVDKVVRSEKYKSTKNISSFEIQTGKYQIFLSKFNFPV